MSRSPQGSLVAFNHLKPGSPSVTQVAEVTYSPFATIPPELLSYILTLAWLSHKGDDSLDRFRFPSIPCKVNRYFNCIANSTPVLWSYLRVTSVIELAHIQDRISRRSGAVPLDLELTFSGVTYDETQFLMQRTILEGSLRLRKIMLFYAVRSVVQIPSGRNFWDHLGLLNGRLLRLAHFSISCENAPPLDSLPLFAASIRSLNVTCNRLDWSRDSLPECLEVLSMQDCGSLEVSATKIVQFLSGSLSQSLRSLSLIWIIVEDPENLINTTCILESLEFFQLEGFELREAVVLLSSIITPNVRHLSLRIETYDDDLSIALRTAWRALRFPHLHKFTLEWYHCCSLPLTEFVQNLPDTVNSLEITGTGPVEDFLNASTVSFCNRLRYIVAYHVPLDALASLVKERCVLLRELETTYSSASEACGNLMREELVTCFSSLKSSVGELRILSDGDPEADEPTCLTLEQLVTSSK